MFVFYGQPPPPSANGRDQSETLFVVVVVVIRFAVFGVGLMLPLHLDENMKRYRRTPKCYTAARLKNANKLALAAVSVFASLRLVPISQLKLEDAVQLTVGNEAYMLFSYDKVTRAVSDGGPPA